MNDIIRNIGKLGESSFRTLCDEINLTYNSSSDNDKTGWDFYFEGYNQIPKSFYDLNYQPIEGKIQVKSTEKGKRAVQIKLSNLLRLAKSPLPSFIILFVFGINRNPEHIYIKHVGFGLIEQILKKTTKNLIKNNKQHNKIELTVNFTEDELLNEATGEKLVEAIYSSVGKDFDKYCNEKSTFIKNVGYEKGSHIINFKIDNQEITNLVDASLGLKKKVNVNLIDINEKRFESVKLLREYNDKALLSLMNVKPIEKGEVFIYTEKYKNPVVFSAELYTPGFNLPIEYFRVRIKCLLFEMLIAPTNNKENLHSLSIDNKLEMHKQYPLAELKKFTTVLSHLMIKNERTYVTAKFKKQFSFQIENITPNTPEFEALKMSESIVRISEIIDFFNYHETLMISPNEIYQRSESIMNFYNMIFLEEKETLRFVYNYNIKPQKISNIFLPLFVNFDVYDKIFSVLIGIVGMPKKHQKDHYEIISSEYFCNDKYI
ncbi:MAG: hypothetical protein PF487_12820, partial [Bacteroidales bacterium]|nr:hypothetical protein [Bacteroidales bacterium]